MNNVKDAVQLIHGQLETPLASWSIGSFGAIAEFHRDASEDAHIEKTSDGGSVISGRGGVRVHLDDACVVAPYETVRRDKRRWDHGVNFCLADDAGAMSRHDALTEVGPDANALRDVDRQSILFDLGLALPHVDVCIRTGDSELTGRLRSHLGQSLFEPGNPAMAAIKEASPQRVFRSRLGRVEVYQSIGSTAKGIPTPEGPHTHVLPGLLAHKRTHAATIPVPDGCVPGLTLYPAHPVSVDGDGALAFAEAYHGAFQEMLRRFGEAETRNLKDRVVDAVRQGDGPSDMAITKYQRAALRVALRQIHWTDGGSAAWEAWTDAFEPSGADPDPDVMTDDSH